MNEDVEVSKGKSVTALWHEAFWFVTHTVCAILAMVAAIYAFSFTHPSPTDAGPKLIGTALAFFFPLIVGFIIAKLHKDDAARFVWISGAILFAIVCVWVIDLPTGPGLCEHCQVPEKLWRTFFDFKNGSGLMAGEGLMVGTWVPLSLVGYAIGAAFTAD